MPQQKRYIKKKINRKAYFGFYLYMLIVLLSLFVMASYTWFSLSRTPRVDSMNVYITSATGLELSQYRDKWTQELNYTDLVPDIFYTEKKNNQTVIKPKTLYPATWSDEEDCFKYATYGVDGRHWDFKPLSDAENEKFKTYKYYFKSTYYARTGTTMDVGLKRLVSMNIDSNLDISSLNTINLSGSFMLGVPGLDKKIFMEAIQNGRMGHASKAVRIGFRFTPVDETGTSISERGPMIIYEPNCNIHVGSGDGYVPTRSLDGTPTLVGEEYDENGNANPRLILQTGTTFTPLPGFDEIQINTGRFLRSPEDPEDPEDPNDAVDTYNPTLFHLEAGEMVKIEMYIWLEGQDIDCTNAGIFALDNLDNIKDNQYLIGNIQFEGDPGSQSGMVPIPKE